jgi:hypothetical protein
LSPIHYLYYLFVNEIPANVYLYQLLPVTMATERDYIQLCTKEIEKLLALNPENENIKTRDFEYLSEVIRQKSGITLSVSTLKRLWKRSFSQIPQPATLNALATVLDYKDWQEFKQKNVIADKKTSLQIPFKKILLPVFLIFLAAISFFAYNRLKNKGPKIKGGITFTADKTVYSRVPNTVIFKYDVSNVAADSFFIQQTWNERTKIRIDPRQGVLSSIYYTPGFHVARLIANNKVIATHNVHILSDGWMPYVYYNINDVYPIYLGLKENVSNGSFAVNEKGLNQKGIDIKKDFMLRLNNSHDFGVSDENFSIKTAVRCDSFKQTVCPYAELMLVFEGNVFWIDLANKGCEYHANYNIGGIAANGRKNDLSLFGCNIYDWQNLELTVKNRKARLLLNSTIVASLQYTKNFGRLVGIIFTFKGPGSVDFVNIYGPNGKPVYTENFD